MNTKTVIFEDNIEDFYKIIDNNKLKVLNIRIINPQPTKDFILRYKKGTKYNDYKPWWRKRWFYNFTYNDNIYEEEILESGKITTNLHSEEDIKYYIKNKHKFQSYIRYIWKGTPEKYPIWTNYRLRIEWDNGYGNSAGYLTDLHLITEDIDKVKEIHNILVKKYIG